ncbi:MAG: hypothetical protein LBK95_01790 [Bifidobacteriaceae bacterium]|jgi:hypothetical protein|nr:hypothetical protein [Bifidobacteriaceae bacterium]
MTFVYRELDTQETERLEALGIQSPWFDGPAMFGKPAVDAEREAIVVGLGGGNLGIPVYWALIVGREVLVLVGDEDVSTVTEDDRRLVVWVNYGNPADSDLWRMPNLYGILKEGLFMVITGDAYEPDRIRFAGDIGRRVEEA